GSSRVRAPPVRRATESLSRRPHRWPDIRSATTTETRRGLSAREESRGRSGIPGGQGPREPWRLCPACWPSTESIAGSAPKGAIGAGWSKARVFPVSQRGYRKHSIDRRRNARRKWRQNVSCAPAQASGGEEEEWPGRRSIWEFFC